MPQMTAAVPPIWTAEELAGRFGPIPLDRIRHDPPPGLGTEQDVVAIHEREDRLYELIDGVLVEKVMGTFESWLAAELAFWLQSYVKQHNLGIVLGADGMVRLMPGLVRIPDVAFISWARMPQAGLRQRPIADLVPDLAVEVLSRGNTREEMEQKLRDYFNAGVRLVWYVDPAVPEIRVYTGPEQCTVLNEAQTLDGGDVLPGFRLELRELFAGPEEAQQA